MKHWIFAASFLGLGGVASAGFPIETEFVCPIGGETFTILETASCSTGGRVTMSFRQLSSCEFVTRLPVCPSNQLPVYREFLDEELPTIEAFMETESYQASLARSHFQRAYLIATELGEANSNTGFSLQLQSMWYEPDLFFSDAIAIEAFFSESDLELDRVSNEDRPFLTAILAYVATMTGQPDRAASYLDRIDRIDLHPSLAAYLDQIESCSTDTSQASCQPLAELEWR